MADHRRERGAGLFSTWFGLVVVLVMFLFAVQVLFDLYARSVVTATAYDTARRVAAYHRGDLTAAESAAESRARGLLGKYSGHVNFDWSKSDANVIRLHVTVDNPRIGFGPFNHAMGLDHIDRTVNVRVERPQP